MANYNDWYEDNNRNPIVMLFDGIFDNLILLPQRTSRLLGWIRFFGFMSLMWFDPFELNLQDTFWIIPYALVCIIEMGIGILQAWGFHWGYRDTGREVIIDETPSVESRGYSKVSDYPNIQRWFSTRDYYLSGMSSTEQAKFFVDTGAITEESIQEMSKYPNTKRALQRLDFELSNRTPKEQVEFLRGYRN
jgi:hypothetical protein